MLNGELQSRTIPLNVEVAARTIGTVEHKVEHNATCVVLNLEIALSVASRVEEHLEVVVVIDDSIALREVSHDVRLLYYSRHVQIFIVPHHSGLGVVNRLGKSVAADVDKRLRVGSLCPRLLVELAVNLYLLVSTTAHIMSWSRQSLCIFLEQSVLSRSGHSEGKSKSYCRKN